MLQHLRLVGFLEGLSYLLLLGVCMPLKYMFDMPEATKLVGMAHGVLFIYYCALVLWVSYKQKWSVVHTGWALLASLLPFGPFVADKKIFKERVVECSL
jgi:integral membrane protein